MSAQQLSQAVLYLDTGVHSCLGFQRFSEVPDDHLVICEEPKELGQLMGLHPGLSHCQLESLQLGLGWGGFVRVPHTYVDGFETGVGLGGGGGKICYCQTKP